MISSEAAVLAVLGLTAGAAAGAVLSIMLVKVLTGVFDPPPSVIAVPWAYLGIVAAVTVLGLAAVTATAARTARRPAPEPFVNYERPGAGWPAPTRPDPTAGHRRSPRRHRGAVVTGHAPAGHRAGPAALAPTGNRGSAASRSPVPALPLSPAATASLRRTAAICTSSVVVEPNQFSSHTSAINTDRVIAVPGSAHEPGQQIELLRPQHELDTAEPSPPGGDIDVQRHDPDRGPGQRTRRGGWPTPRMSVDPSQQLREPERLGQIVVRARLQPHHHIDLLVPSGQHHQHATGQHHPQPPAHLDTVHIR